MILDVCVVVRQCGVSCFGEGAEVFEIVVNFNLCYELLSLLGHSVETFLVGALHQFSFLSFRNIFEKPLFYFY